MSKNTKRRQAQANGLLVFISAVAVLAAIVLLLALATDSQNSEATLPQSPTSPVKIETPEEVNINLGYGLYITDVAKYTGLYMEDGSDEIVSGILMIVVKNTGDTAVQLADIEMPVGEQTAYFRLTTLPAGESAVLLEMNRMMYVDTDYTTAISKNVVLFQEPLGLCETQLKIQAMDGVLNITNISGEDIAGDIVIYYKNSSSDMLYGGITYRITVSGGLKAGEIKQITSSHFRGSGSRIMQITIG